MIVYKENKKGSVKMTEYQRLETKIEKYLARVDVKKTTSIVSVYDVYKAL